MTRTIVKSLLGALAAFVFEVGLDVLLRREGTSRPDLLLISNGLTAAMVGLLVYVISARAAHKRALDAARLGVVREVNHHVRNALQVISFFVHTAGEEPYSLMVKQAIERIDWVLKEVLTTGKPLDADAAWPEGLGANEVTNFREYARRDAGKGSMKTPN